MQQLSMLKAWVIVLMVSVELMTARAGPQCDRLSELNRISVKLYRNARHKWSEFRVTDTSIILPIPDPDDEEWCSERIPIEESSVRFLQKDNEMNRQTAPDRSQTEQCDKYRYQRYQKLINEGEKDVIKMERKIDTTGMSEEECQQAMKKKSKAAAPIKGPNGRAPVKNPDSGVPLKELLISVLTSLVMAIAM